jgi:hypothetical protein
MTRFPTGRMHRSKADKAIWMGGIRGIMGKMESKVEV